MTYMFAADHRDIRHVNSCVWRWHSLYLIVMIKADGLQECELRINRSSVICLAFELLSLTNV